MAANTFDLSTFFTKGVVACPSKGESVQAKHVREILRLALEVDSNATDVCRWFSEQSVVDFDNLTAAEMIEHGRGKLVIAYLERILRREKQDGYFDAQ